MFEAQAGQSLPPVALYAGLTATGDTSVLRCRRRLRLVSGGREAGPIPTCQLAGHALAG